MAADPLVDRTHVQAGRAADAAQRRPAHRVGRHPARPLSSSTTCSRRGPSPGVTPVKIEVYGFIRSPVDERGSRRRKISEVGEAGQQLLHPDHGDQGVRQGQAHPAVALGLDDHQGAGLGDREVGAADRDPGGEEGPPQVLAGPPRPARRGRREVGVEAGHPTRRTAPGSAPGCSGSPAPGCATGCRRRAARSARPGRSRPPSIPAAASASLRPISWVAIDLTFTTRSTPCARTSSVTTALASAASRRSARSPRRRWPAASNCASSSGSRSSTSSLIAGPASRSALPVGHLADHRGPLVPDGAGGAAQVAPGAARRPSAPAAAGGRAVAAHDGPAGSSRALRMASVRHGPVTGSGRGEDLGVVDGAPGAGPRPGQAAADVGQAGVVRRRRVLGAGGATAWRTCRRAWRRRRRRSSARRCRRSRSTPRLGQVDQLEAAHRAEQPARPVAQAQHPQRRGRSGGR